MASNTAQTGIGQVGDEWLGTGGDSFVPVDPSTQPWYPARNSGEPPPWRRRTQASWARGPELPQPPLNPLTIPPATICSTREQEVTPPWRRRTQPSRVEPWFPSFIPSQQIDLINQAIDHRIIGTPSLTGGAQGLFVFISGVNQSGTFAALSCRITRQLGTTGQCTVVFHVPAGGFTPLKGAAFILNENNTRLFAGLIESRQWTVLPGTSVIEWTIVAVDWNGLMQRHIIAKDYTPAPLLSIVSDMLAQPTIFADVISTAQVDATLDVGDDVSFSYIKYSDALGQLALETNTIWWIDNYKTLYQILTGNAPTSTYKLVEDGSKQADPNIVASDDLDNYRNTQYVRAANQLLSESVTVTDSHTFTGATADIVDITRYPLVSAPFSVLENGIEIVGSDRFFELKTDGSTVYPASGDGWYWIAGGFGVWHWPSFAYPTAGTTLAVTYTGISTFAGNVVKYQDSAQILDMQAISGGSGVYEELEDYSGALTYSQALALAEGTEQGTAPPPLKIQCSTTEIVEDIGYAVTVNLPRWGIAGTFIIQQLDREDLGANLGKGTRFRTTLQLVSARTLGNFTQYWERLYARLNKALVVAPTEKPTWGLAFDTPGNPSAGLQPGAFGEPYAIQTGLGRILYVSVVFADAADQNIVIDILLNGVSIFTSARLVYTPGSTGTQILYANFNPNKVNVTRGDLLTLNVIQAGLISPGKNGTVAVVIGQR